MKRAWWLDLNETSWFIGETNATVRFVTSCNKSAIATKRLLLLDDNEKRAMISVF